MIRWLGDGGRYINSNIPPLLVRFGTTGEIWLEVVKKFEVRRQGGSVHCGTCTSMQQVT